MKLSLVGLVFALLVRIFVSLVSYHPDIKSQHFHAQYLGKGVVNIYDYIAINKNNLPYKDTFNYPPTTYLLLGSWNFVAGKIMGADLNTWINDWNSSTFFRSEISAYLLILKLPYFLVDLMLLSLLLFLVPKGSRNNLFNIWAFNPISLYAIYAIGQFDILPAFLTLVALASFIRRKFILVGIFLGLAISLKTYPILMIPIFILHSQSVKTVLKIALSTIVTYLATIVPYLGSNEFINSVFRSSLGSKLFEYKLDLTFIKIPIFPLFYSSFILWILLTKKNLTNLYKQLFILTFSFLIFTNYHPQWIIWSIPFLAVNIFNKSMSIYLSICLLLIYVVIFLLIPDLYLSIGLLSVLNPNIITIPAFAGFIPKIEEIRLMLKLIFGSIFFYSMFKKSR